MKFLWKYPFWGPLSLKNVVYKTSVRMQRCRENFSIDNKPNLQQQYQLDQYAGERFWKAIPCIG